MEIKFEIDGAVIIVKVDPNKDINLTVDDETIWISPATAQLLALTLFQAATYDWKN